MAVVNFIEFYTTLAEALTERTSPQIDFYALRGIQLLPNNPYPYIQTTDVSTGIELEDWTASLINTWNGEETDITAYFTVENVFVDDDGMAQFDWSLTNVPYDYGGHMVYLKVEQLIGETFYSNMFQLTDNNSDKTVRIDYRDDSNDTMQSIQLKMWFWQTLKNQELSNYYETSTKNTVTTMVKSQKYERWITEVMSNSLFLKITDVFELKFKYLDLVRAYLFDNAEVKEHSGRENFARNILKISFNANDTYDPSAAASPAPVPDVPIITLLSIVANGIRASYTFTYAYFTPTYLVYEYSQDEVSWTSTNAGATSPMIVDFNGTGVWYFRISHPEAISNTIMLDLGTSVVAVNDIAQVAKGGVIDISVLLNDTLVGTTTITAVTSPTNGTAVAINGNTQIRYTHDDSVTTADSFDYTIGNGLTSDSATVSMVITPSSATVNSFLTNATGHASQAQAALLPLDTTRYFSGDLSYPEIGDVIYTDAAGTTTFNGGNKWFPLYIAQTIKINSSGIVTNAGFA